MITSRKIYDSTPTNENPKEKEVYCNDSQTIVTPEIVPSPSDPNITSPHVMSRIPNIPRRSQQEIPKPKRYEELGGRRGECTTLICPWHFVIVVTSLTSILQLMNHLVRECFVK